MYGRASTTFTAQELAIWYLNPKPLIIPDLRPNYNLCPTQNTVVLRVVDNERKFDSMRFGLIPLWAKNIASTSCYSLINAKDEDMCLDPENATVTELQKLLKPCSSEWLDAYEVSTLVNSPKNNRPEILQPVHAG